MHDELLQIIGRDWPASQWTDVNVLVAVSGGSDSVALLRLLHEAKKENPGRGELVVCHYNHRWRGDDSDKDAVWVENLTNELGIHSVVGVSQASGPRSEEDLRNERREFYRSAADECGARFLATAHTADDQAETVLFRALRGSGISGLSGISHSASLSSMTTLIRPLLSCTKQNLVEYLQSIDQSWSHDATNEDLGPTRNWIRNELLPLAEKRIPHSKASLKRLATQSAEVASVFCGLAEELLAQSQIEPIPNGLQLDCQTLGKAHSLIRREAIRLAWKEMSWPEKDMRADHWHMLADLSADTEAKPAQHFPGGIKVQVANAKLVLACPRDGN